MSPAVGARPGSANGRRCRDRRLRPHPRATGRAPRSLRAGGRLRSARRRGDREGGRGAASRRRAGPSRTSLRHRRRGAVADRPADRRQRHPTGGARCGAAERRHYAAARRAPRAVAHRPWSSQSGSLVPPSFAATPAQYRAAPQKPSIVVASCRDQSALAQSRRTNFWTLPVEVIGSSRNTTWRGHL